MFFMLLLSFIKSDSNVAFKGKEGLFKTNPTLVPRVVVLPGVSDEFVTKITKQISEFSADWLLKLKKNNYKIILSPTYSEAYRYQGVIDPIVEAAEKKNPKGTLAVTYTDGVIKNFFVFCDKPPYSNDYMPEIVNHELSHGVVNVAGLNNDKKVIGELKRDVELIMQEQKMDKLTPAENAMVTHCFFNPNAHLPIDEILSDVYAWNKGRGCYGSGLVMGVKNPNLMGTLFPNLSECLKTV